MMTDRDPRWKKDNPDSRICHLCGGADFSDVLFYKNAMTSDCQPVNANLHKIQCHRCGLICNAEDIDRLVLNDFYQESYKLAKNSAQAEALFNNAGKIQKRSDVVAGWIAEFIKEEFPASPELKILEVGCGDGRILQAVQGIFPLAQMRGLEPNKDACEIAEAAGLSIIHGLYEDLQNAGERYDVIYSFAVLEHLKDPSYYLQIVKKALAPGGVLILSQPCQDVPSHDLYFIDHLYHFHSEHISSLALKNGFVPARIDVGHPVIPAFSMHSLRLATRPSEADCQFPENFDIIKNIDVWETRIKGINNWLEKLRKEPVCIWGVGEVFLTLLNYTDLSPERIAAGFDNNFERYRGHYSFPVLPPVEDEMVKYKNTPWFLSFKPPRQVIDDLAKHNINFISLESLQC